MLSTLNTLYALTIGTAMAGLVGHTQNTALTAALYPVASVLGLSFVVAAVMALSAPLPAAAEVKVKTELEAVIAYLQVLGINRK